MRPIGVASSAPVLVPPKGGEPGTVGCTRFREPLGTVGNREPTYVRLADINVRWTGLLILAALCADEQGCAHASHDVRAVVCPRDGRGVGRRRGHGASPSRRRFAAQRSTRWPGETAACCDRSAGRRDAVTGGRACAHAPTCAACTTSPSSTRCTWSSPGAAPSVGAASRAGCWRERARSRRPRWCAGRTQQSLTRSRSPGEGIGGRASLPPDSRNSRNPFSYSRWFSPRSRALSPGFGPVYRALGCPADTIAGAP